MFSCKEPLPPICSRPENLETDLSRPENLETNLFPSENMETNLIMERIGGEREYMTRSVMETGLFSEV
jgi:hypothetical protein